MKIRGLHTHRFDDNPEEQQFAEAWDRINSGGRILDYLLDPKSGSCGRPIPRGDGEVVAAATLVQWLGSPVGRSFLRELGYVKPNDAAQTFTLHRALYDALHRNLPSTVSTATIEKVARDVIRDSGIGQTKKPV